MKLIKLSAIDSTNLFLKNLAENTLLENSTVVMAENQTAGRGQMHTVWKSEPGKNLTFSVFERLDQLSVAEQRYLNYAAALSVWECLEELGVANVQIKWPNDIMAGHAKICGLLVENTLKGSDVVATVIGIGLNVNQSFKEITSFKATSLVDVLEQEFPLEMVLRTWYTSFEKYMAYLNNRDYDLLESRYLKVLYKKNVPSMFKTAENELFLGKIVGVSTAGKLRVELADETHRDFGIKEISFA